MLVFGFIYIAAFFTWLRGGNVSEVVEEKINSAFSGFGKMCIIHFILTILATLFYEKTEKATFALQIFEPAMVLGFWLTSDNEHSSKNSK